MTPSFVMWSLCLSEVVGYGFALLLVAIFFWLARRSTATTAAAGTPSAARHNRPVSDLIARMPVRIEVKLLTAFLAIVALMILLGAIGLGVLCQLNRHVDDLIDTDRKIADYYRLQHDADSVLVAISSAIWMPGLNRLKDTEREIKRFQKLDLDRLAVAVGEDTALTELQRESARFVAVLDRIMELRQNGSVDQIGTLLLEQAQPSAVRLEQLTNRLVSKVEADMAACIEASHSAYRYGQTVVIGFALGSILLGIYFGRTISALIVGPLRQIGMRLSRIATGDFDQFVSIPNRDELGVLAENVNRTSEQLDELYSDLEREKERSEKLLLQILPRAIAGRLRSGETQIADHIPEATILFSDLAGFTALSSTMAAVEIVEMLDLLFSRFDALVARHGLEKIKTIGDGYMVAGGVPEAMPDHAAVVVEMALAMQEATNVATRALGVIGQPLRVRIGIHSGPLVAGVLGTEKLIYDVWGDTVNIASRMEKYGEPGRIHVSAATQALLGDRYRFEPRGKIDIKGKGKMETYFVEAPMRSPLIRADTRIVGWSAPSLCRDQTLVVS